MRKTDLIHLHALLACVEADLEERGEVRADRLDEYRQLDVSPMSIRASRERHEEAVLALARGLAASVADSAEGEDRGRTEGAERPAA